jgi:pimeloyl-ACP methyl ester carboxylesterase
MAISTRSCRWPAVSTPPKASPGARLLVVPGMGHALPISKWPQIIDAIAAHAV